MNRSDVESWVAGYERAWRSPGTLALADLFSPDAVYRMHPWDDGARGLAQIEALWEREREGPDEAFDMRSWVVAVDGDTAVVRLDVEYRRPADEPRWRDLWILRFDASGRCAEFEEWAKAPE